ncbi:MAG TPA: hypothetical protein VGR53_05195 [Nitrososphaerales archaeon]|nr:hypothetical protein [Nitrososphaerales archaeon]
MQVELLALNGVVFSALGIGIAIRLRRKPPGPEELGALYRRVSYALSRRFPDLPRGFTLREGLARAHPSSPGINWTSLETELGSYEAFRFGGANEPSSPASETLKFLNVLGGS